MYDEWYGKRDRLERPFFYHDLSTERFSVRALIRKFEIRASATLLDIGCGNGLYANLFRENGLFVFGVDLSDRAIDYCKETYADACTWVLSSAFELSCTRTFDYVFCHFFTYFNAFDDLHEAREDAKRLLGYLTPCGRLFFVRHIDLTAVRLDARRFGIVNFTPRRLEAMFEGHSVQTYAIDSRARLCRLLGRHAFGKVLTRLTRAMVVFSASSWQRARLLVVVEKSSSA